MAQKMVWRTFVPATTAVLCIVFAGCGYGESSRVPVQGKVVMDGAPLESGVINFTPTETGREKASGPIQGGTYSIPAAQGPNPGAYRVEIIARKKTGRKIGTPGDSEVQMDEVGEVRAAGNLTADVKAQANTFDFTDLKAEAGSNQGQGGKVRAAGD